MQVTGRLLIREKLSHSLVSAWINSIVAKNELIGRGKEGRERLEASSMGVSYSKVIAPRRRGGVILTLGGTKNKSPPNANMKQLLSVWSDQMRALLNSPKL